jgi:hypothetical protein
LLLRQLAERIARDIEQSMQPANSWPVVLDGQGQVRSSQRDEAAVTWLPREPETGFWRRFRAGLIARFPIEKYL